MAIPIPPLNLNLATSSGATAGPITSQKSGNAYNFGGANSQLPGWLLAVGAAAAALWLIKRKKG